MLVLTPDQQDLLLRLALQRYLQRLGAACAPLWPALAERLQDRYPAFVELAVQHAQRHGLADGLCVARYVNLWFVFGPAFDEKPGYEWAREILSDGRRGEAARAHQLSVRTKEELGRRATPKPAGPAVPGAAVGASGLPTVDVYESSEEKLAAAMRDSGRLGDLLEGSLDELLPACDVELVEVALKDISWRQVYRKGEAADAPWQRQPLGAFPDRVRVGNDMTALPPELAVLSSSRGTPATLVVRTRPLTLCDAHPRLSLAGAQGLQEWRGRDALAVSLPLFDQSQPGTPANGLVPPLAVESSPTPHLLKLVTCGIRDAGLPIGELNTRIAVYSAEQWLQVWRLAPLSPIALPEGHGAPLAAPALSLKLERDGQQQDHTAWQRGFSRLPALLHDSLGKLLTAWERTSGVTGGRLEAESALLAGQAGLAWGWREGPLGLVEAPYLHVDAVLELIACALDLRLRGQFDWHGTRSQLLLRCQGRSELRVRAQRDAATLALPAAMQPAQTAFRFPFTLELEPVATEDLALLQAAAPTGAISGACGLRPKTDGPGLQWFANLKVEAAGAAFTVADPLLGGARQARPLLPAMTLLDWSLG
ncbi:MAG: hypothetical protein EPO01_15265 [Aquabacterium sp.]|nr:MAG: hypothetical protein EPO01_15265 [Aquabacterium sp.]